MEINIDNFLYNIEQIKKKCPNSKIMPVIKANAYGTYLNTRLDVLNRFDIVCLENQIFVKAENKETVSEFVKNNGGSITTMIRYEVGEGMQKREENFAEEVAKQMQGK